MKLLILNGPNLNLLGLREPDIYGRQNYAALVRFCEDTCREADISCKVFQSNHEGALVDEIQAAYGVFDGIVINPAAYTHTSVAILGRAEGCRTSGGRGASVRRDEAREVPADLLCPPGLREDLHGPRLRGLPAGHSVFERISE